MAAAKPSQASVTNVLAAITAQGLAISGIQVDPDGGFRVLTTDVPAPESVDPVARNAIDLPPKRWGSRG